MPERPIQAACEDAKQRLIALAAKIDKYKNRVKQYRENRMFHLNQRQFYRNLENPGGTTKVNDIPNNSEVIATFWRDLWSQEKQHNHRATWIQTVKDDQKDTQEQQVAKITVDIVRKCLRTMANWKSPGPDQIHAYWLKKLTSTHDRLAKFLDRIVNGGEQVPTWLPHSTTPSDERPAEV